MMKKISSSKFTPGVFMVLTVIGAILFRSCRYNWVFVTSTVGFDLPNILLAVMVLLSALFGVVFTLNIYGSKFNESKAYKYILRIGGVLSSLLFIYGLAYAIGCSIDEMTQCFTIYLKQTLREGAFLLLVPFFAIFYPKLSCKAKKVIGALALVAAILFGVNSFYPLAPYKITSDPMVIDNGSGYSIVFSTNDIGTAYAEYTYEGEEYKVFDNAGGRLNGDSKIHSISVPYEHLRNNTYKVGSTRVIEEYSYGSRLGASVVSKEYELRINESDDQTWLVISDWHAKLEKAYKTIGNFTEEYDGVILLGDSSPSMDFQEQAVTTIVEFGGTVTQGNKPVLYVRGNHETRGDYANNLPEALGLEQFYYTSQIGPYSFVVLDSGEDKVDSHIEYGGLNDYGTYRADMVEWMKSVEVESEKVIAISHAWRISSVEPELSQTAWAELDRLGTRLLLSGHEHTCRIIGEREGDEKQLKEKYPDIIGYIDGGKIGKGYVASMLTLNENGFEIKAVDTEGNEVINESFAW